MYAPPRRRFLLLLLGLAAVPPGVFADGPRRDRGGNRGGGLSADQAAERARRQSGGRVLKVEPRGDGYRVKVLTPKGEVREEMMRGGGR